MPQLEFDRIESPVGNLTIMASGAGLTAVLWDGEKTQALRANARHAPENPVLARTRRELAEYFRGERRTFSVPLAPTGTAFQMQAWQALRSIPFGETRSYQQQAAAIGSPSKTRAVGAANGKNPISIIVPCHRVIGKNGTLTGFGGGLAAKAFLLELERKFCLKDGAGTLTRTVDLHDVNVAL